MKRSDAEIKIAAHMADQTRGFVGEYMSLTHCDEKTSELAVASLHDHMSLSLRGLPDKISDSATISMLEGQLAEIHADNDRLKGEMADICKVIEDFAKRSVVMVADLEGRGL